MLFEFSFLTVTLLYASRVRTTLRVLAVYAVPGLLMLTPPARMRAQAPGSGAEPDLTIVRRRLLEPLLPSEARPRDILVDSARAVLGAQLPDGSWPDVPYADRSRALWPPKAHLDRLLILARAYRTPGQPLLGAPELDIAIRRGLDLWFARDPQSDNWWFNQINTPYILGETLLLFEDRLTQEQRERGLAIMRRSALVTMIGRQRMVWTGANLVWMARGMILRGLLEPSAATLDTAFHAIAADVRIARAGEEGIQADYSFHQHGPVLYTGGYGAAYLDEVARFDALARETRWAFPPDAREILERFVLEGIAPTVRGAFYDYAVVGREITRPGKNARALEAPVALLAEMPGPRQPALRALLARLRGQSGADAPSVTTHYWRSDYLVHHRPDYLISAHLYSTRTAATDRYINGEGKKSFYLADGATLLYRRGDEYRDVFPVWDWARVPGTMVEQGVTRPLTDIGARGRSDRVGGVADGRAGIATMLLERDSLSATKSWFFFDRAVVSLGAGIRCPTPNSVFTSVNQLEVRGAVHDTLADGMRIVEHDSVAYVFPATTNLVVRVAPQTGSWAEIGAGPSDPITRNVFSVWIDHGRNVRDGEYRYVTVPVAANAGKIARELEVVANTPALQAVRHRDAGILGIAFHEPGSVDAGAGWRVTASAPSLVLLRETPGGLVVSVASERNEAGVVTVSVDRMLGEAPDVERTSGGSRVRFVLPGGVDAGRAVTRVFPR